jgi:hypothetical protein
MTLPASGALSLSQVLTELGLPAGTQINFDDSRIRALTGTATGTAVRFPTDFYGKSAFTLAFNNGEDFQLDISTGAGTSVAQITLFPNASISKYVTGSFSTLGPTAWASPLTGGIGSSYEFRVVMSYLYLAQEAGPVDFPIFTVAGVSYPSATTTPWYTISSNRLIEAYSGYGECNATGTIEIRNISTLATISRAYTMSARGGPP